MSYTILRFLSSYNDSVPTDTTCREVYTCLAKALMNRHTYHARRWRMRARKVSTHWYGTACAQIPLSASPTVQILTHVVHHLQYYR